MNDVLSFVVDNAEAILTVVALLLSALGVIAKLTPSDTDNKVLAAIKGVVDLLTSFVKRKPAPPAPPVSLEGEEHAERKPGTVRVRDRLDR